MQSCEISLGMQNYSAIYNVLYGGRMLVVDQKVCDTAS